MLKKDFDITLEIIAVSDLYYGSSVDPKDLYLADLASLQATKGALQSFQNGSLDADNLDVIAKSEADIIVEATFTGAKTGEPMELHCYLSGFPHFLNSYQDETVSTIF